MVRLMSALSAALPLLSFSLPLSLAQSTPPTWEIQLLAAIDAPVDATQTAPTPVPHHLSFRIVDNQLDCSYDCSADWTDATGIPPRQHCQPAPGNPDQDTLFRFVVESYADAEGPFTVDVEEFKTAADVMYKYTGSFTEVRDKDGGRCFEAPLQNNSSVTFSSCGWPTFFLPSTSFAP